MIAFSGNVPAAGTHLYELTGSFNKRSNYVNMQSRLVYGAGGTSIKVFLQTTLDNGTTWRDVVCQAFLIASANKASAICEDIALAASVAATDGTMADDTILQGLFGLKWRVKVVIVGTYTTSTLRIDVDNHSTY